jgi:lipoprotein-releasing system permease protein
LFLQSGNYSSLEIALQKNTNAADIQTALQKLLGKNFHIATRYEQNQTLYMVMKTEKWAVYGILLLVLIIASFNMVGALTLLVLEKQKDIAILRAMGASSASIGKIFIMEGALWATIGGSFGLLVGVALCRGQQYFKWIKLQGAFIIDAYPVSIQWGDMLLIIATVLSVGILAAWYPAIKAIKAEDPSLKAS